MLALVSFLVPVAERLRVPYAVVLALTGLALGFVGPWLTSFGLHDGVVVDVFHALDGIHQVADSFVSLFLPPLLMTAGLTVDVRRLLDEFSAVMLLAIVAVVVCIGAVGGVVHYTTGVELVTCLLLGTVVSTTDPAAVIAIFRDVGAPKRLSILAEGESLFNDAVAISAFTLFVGILVSRASGAPAVAGSSEAAAATIEFLREFAGGLLLGFVLARGAVALLPKLGDSDSAIASVTLSLTYGGFILADDYLHCSGVVCVVTAALTLAAYGPTQLHPRRWSALRQIWHQLEFWASCLIFVLAAMLASKVLPRMGMPHLLVLAAVVTGAFTARALVVFGMLPALEALGLVQPVDGRYKVILVWGGLRGAVTIVLAMVAAGNPGLPPATQEFVALSATIFVLFTLFLNATTLGLVMRWLGLDRLSPLDVAMRDRVRALSRAAADGQLRKLGLERRGEAAAVPGNADTSTPSSTAAVATALPPELALPLDERTRIGLVALAVREREHVLELFDQQILSRRMVAILSASAERLVDLVRDRGIEGQATWIEDASRPDRLFRIALFLQRRVGFEGLLAASLADRMEALMVTKGVLQELAGRDLASIADLVGHDAEEKIAEAFARRRTAVDDAYRALSLQYPGYADAIQARQVERAVIRVEGSEYAKRLREGSISREVYDCLAEDLDARRRVAASRPPLDLGLELAAMIAGVPLFAGLDSAAIADLGRCLRARVAVPGEPIVATGESADSMYFVAAGSVVVHARRRSERLGQGEFFGEMGLLGSMPRNADVVADGYCHLLVLSKKDFNRTLQRRPGLKAEIEAVAARRGADNRDDAPATVV